MGPPLHLREQEVEHGVAEIQREAPVKAKTSLSEGKVPAKIGFQSGNCFFHNRKTVNAVTTDSYWITSGLLIATNDTINQFVTFWFTMIMHSRILQLKLAINLY